MRHGLFSNLPGPIPVKIDPPLCTICLSCPLRGWRSFLRHPGFAQASEIGRLGKGAELRHFEPLPSRSRLQVSYARIVMAKPAGFAERDRGTFRLAFEGITGRKGRMDSVENGEARRRSSAPSPTTGSPRRCTP